MSKRVEGFLVSWLTIEESPDKQVTTYGACVVDAKNKDEAEGATRRVLQEKWPQARISLSTQENPDVCDPSVMALTDVTKVPELK